MTTYKEIMTKLKNAEEILPDYHEKGSYTEYELSEMLHKIERIYNCIHHEAYCFANEQGFESWEELQEYNRKEALKATFEMFGWDFRTKEEK